MNLSTRSMQVRTLGAGPAAGRGLWVSPSPPPPPPTLPKSTRHPCPAGFTRHPSPTPPALPNYDPTTDRATPLRAPHNARTPATNKGFRVFWVLETLIHTYPPHPTLPQVHQAPVPGRVNQTPLPGIPPSLHPPCPPSPTPHPPPIPHPIPSHPIPSPIPNYDPT